MTETPEELTRKGYTTDVDVFFGFNSAVNILVFIKNNQVLHYFFFTFEGNAIVCISGLLGTTIIKII